MNRFAGILVALCLSPGTVAAAGPARVLDLSGRHLDPLEAPPGIKAIVFVFTTADCPISNRYAPELRRLHETFAAKGVLFWLVYPNPGEEPDAIRGHMKAFAYPMAALRDPRHELVRLAQVTVAPEAAVFDRRGRMVYRGRIDDRYVDFGVDRPVPAHRDLEEALAATLAGRGVSNPRTRAVGCFLADLLR